jgi:hypothetical protein
MDLKYLVEPLSSGGLVQRIANSKATEKPCAMMISGCRDTSTSADTYDATYGATGAMTAAFLRAVLQNRHRPVCRIIQQMRSELRRGGYWQIPQLSCSRRLTGASRIYGVGTM